MRLSVGLPERRPRLVMQVQGEVWQEEAGAEPRPDPGSDPRPQSWRARGRRAGGRSGGQALSGGGGGVVQEVGEGVQGALHGWLDAQASCRAPRVPRHQGTQPAFSLLRRLRTDRTETSGLRSRGAPSNAWTPAAAGGQLAAV